MYGNRVTRCGSGNGKGSLGDFGEGSGNGGVSAVGGGT